MTQQLRLSSPSPHASEEPPPRGWANAWEVPTGGPERALKWPRLAAMVWNGLEKSGRAWNDLEWSETAWKGLESCSLIPVLAHVQPVRNPGGSTEYT